MAAKDLEMMLKFSEKELLGLSVVDKVSPTMSSTDRRAVQSPCVHLHLCVGQKMAHEVHLLSLQAK